MVCRKECHIATVKHGENNKKAGKNMGNYPSAGEEFLNKGISIVYEYLVKVSNWIIKCAEAIDEGFETGSIQLTKGQFLFLMALSGFICFIIAKPKRITTAKKQSKTATTANKQQPIKRKQRNMARTWYPSGWAYNEKKELWEPPDFIDVGSRTEQTKEGNTDTTKTDS